MTDFDFVVDESRLIIHAKSTIHPIHTDASGVTGSLRLDVKKDGSIKQSKATAGSLQFELNRLSSGNPLYDRETERRIEVRKYPLVEATLAGIEYLGPDEETTGSFRYRVSGDLTFHGVTQSLDGAISFRVIPDDPSGQPTVQIWGEQVIDVRAWKINPPRLGLIKVHPEVLVRIEATARAEA